MDPVEASDWSRVGGICLVERLSWEPTAGQGDRRRRGTGSHVIGTGSDVMATGSHVIWKGKPLTGRKKGLRAQGDGKSRGLEG